jgi:hypothetical protein
MAYLYKQKVWWKRLLGAFLFGLPISTFLGWLVIQLSWLALVIFVAPFVVLTMLMVGAMLMDGTL